MREREKEIHAEVSQKCLTSEGAILDDASFNLDLSHINSDPEHSFVAVSHSGLDLLAGVCTTQSYLQEVTATASVSGLDYQSAVSLLQTGNDITSDDVTAGDDTVVGVAGSRQSSDSDSDSETSVEPAGKRRKLTPRTYKSGKGIRRRKKRKRFSRLERESRLVSDSESESEYEPMSDSDCESDSSLSGITVSHSPMSDTTVSENPLSDTTVSHSQMSDSNMTEGLTSDILTSGSAMLMPTSICRPSHTAPSESCNSATVVSDITNNASYGMPDSDSSSGSSSEDSGAESDSESDHTDDEVDLRFRPNPCSIYCPCRSAEAASEKPTPIPRRRNVDTQMYRKLLLCRLLCDDNRLEHQCCWKQCHHRWAAKQHYQAWMFGYEYDDDDDLSVHYFSWGRWKPTGSSGVSTVQESNPEHQGGKTGGSIVDIASCNLENQHLVSGTAAAATVDDLIGPVSDSDSESDSDCDDLDLNEPLSESSQSEFTFGPNSTASFSIESSTSYSNNTGYSSDNDSDSDSTSDSDSDSSSDSDSDSSSESDSGSSSSSASSCSCSDSDSEAYDPWADDSERVIDVRYETNPCRKSCPCSRSFEPDPPAAISRSAPVEPPLYTSLLRYRLLRPDNMERYACCLHACQDSWLRRAQS